MNPSDKEEKSGLDFTVAEITSDEVFAEDWGPIVALAKDVISTLLAELKPIFRYAGVPGAIGVSAGFGKVATIVNISNRRRLLLNPDGLFQECVASGEGIGEPSEDLWQQFLMSDVIEGLRTTINQAKNAEATHLQHLAERQKALEGVLANVKGGYPF